MRRRTSVSALAAALIASTASVASGQSAIYGAGLQAWLGCWSAELSAVRADAAPTIVCVTPTARVDVADVVTVQDGRIVARETLDASGAPRPIDAARCTGTRSGSWSRDGRRLFVRSFASCAGVSSSTSGLLTMTAEGDWLDVEGISAGGGTSVRVARYREVAPPMALSLAARSALRAQALATRSVRTAAGAPVRAEDVLEASRALDSAVVAAWVLERAQRFDVTDAELAALVSAGVPPRTAAALDAVADPQSYTVARGVDEGTPYAVGYPIGWRYGFYGPPVVIVRGYPYRPRGRAAPGQGGYPRGTGASTTPPAGDPRHAPPAQQAGATLRLGKPRS